ncbi:MAG: formimidoylglutamase [Bdellovibrionales bacterium]|nr:formimidoylglutamase [Bdellovibrionales bacterium]
MGFDKADIYKGKYSDDPRMGNLVTSSMEDADYVIQGYPDDEGIDNNNGRMGASQGPNGIRQIFYKTTPHQVLETPGIYDAGNLILDDKLSNRHEIAKAQAKSILSKDKVLIGLGGGHDYAYPDGASFIEDSAAENTKPLIINFDAHLDLRPVTDRINSGTPFYRLLSEYPNQFDFIQIGLQQVCNSKNHFEWGKERGMQSVWLEDYKASGENLSSYFVRRFENIFTKKPPTYLSIDIDVFSSSVAPGASQSWPYGLMPEDFFPLFLLLIERLPVKLLGIYEVSPPLDENLKTQRLAEQIIHRFIYRY